VRVRDDTGEPTAQFLEERFDVGQFGLESSQAVDEVLKFLFFCPKLSKAGLERADANVEEGGNLNIPLFTRSDLEERLDARYKCLFRREVDTMRA
jgi:hypothetical protein